jgi:predicted MFS family arabinose efflux permease
MLGALWIRDFRLLWSARLISLLGSWLLVIAVPAHVFTLTGSIAATFLPVALLAPVAGVIADRWDRRWLMVGADVFRAVAIAVMFAARTPDTVWIVYFALVAESAGSVVFRPAAQAQTPLVVGTGPQLSSANSLNALVDGTVRLIGGPLGAVLLALAGFDVLIVADCASYLISAAAIVMTRSHPRATRKRGIDFSAGFRVVAEKPFVRALLPVTVTFLMADAALSALLIPFGLANLGDNQQLGYLMSALGVGFLAGAPLARFLVDRVQAKYVLTGSLATTALGFVVLFHATLAPALGAGVVIGMAGSTALITPTVVLQRILPNDVLGRVIAVFITGEALASFVGALVGPVGADAFGMTTVATIASAVTLVAGLACLLLPHIRSDALISAGTGYARSTGSNPVASSSDPA